AGVLLKSAEIEPRVTWVAMAAVLGALAFFWLAIWILDFGYYSRLLMGAVRALLDLEGTSAGQIQLSTMIEKTVRPKGDPKDAAGSPLAVRFFYALVLGVLIVATVASWDIGRHSSALPPMPPYELVRPTSYTGQ
ncbi:MAG TPA: hypothetical protein VFR41_00925, partial [Acidimicrobiia bacterium]|nr:hypothetical protein [Acidimicrobiia bacterium]